MDFTLIFSSFLAGVLTFLAPCTLPLVPGYLGFISGVAIGDLNDPNRAKMVRRKIFFNGLLYVLGFSSVFVILGTVFGLGGAYLAEYRYWLARIGGVFVIIFGLYMMHLLKIPFFNSEKRFHVSALKPGRPFSSLIFGMAFAFGWTPCIGPILGTVLTLAASYTTVLQGAGLLLVFSLGLAVPFLLVAIGFSSATAYIHKISKYLKTISFIGGVFLVFLGILLLTNNLGTWMSFFYQTFNFINYDKLLNYL
ncbi:MAG: sulfite exporter TauE/SafE family protein [Candidatus Magasanikbacteria bacterium]|nr:sulfite exporter TauE/SafE family protein [Candidatus Magasanikbacteria bacterium]